jgi:hypothetical protein
MPILDVTPIKQDDERWCWVTVASMVSVYYARSGGGPAKRPCEIASLALVQDCCNYVPPSPPPVECRKAGYVEDALAVIHHLADTVQPSNSFSVVVAEIAAQKPLCSSFQFFAGPLHYLLVVGVDLPSGEVSFVDPADGHLYQSPYPAFLQNAKGHWVGWTFTR